MDITTEKENFFRVALLVLDVIPMHLRQLFKDSWNKKFPLKPWIDGAASGQHFMTEMKNKKTQMKDQQIKERIKNGDTSDWDCTTLFFAILYSRVQIIDAAEKPHVDNLRIMRNKYFGHMTSSQLPKQEFDDLMANLMQNFTALGFNTSDITDVETTTMETVDVKSLKGQLEAEKEKNDEFNSRLSLVEEKVEDIEMKTSEQGATIGQHTNVLSQFHTDLAGLEVKSSEHTESIANVEVKSSEYTKSIANLEVKSSEHTESIANLKVKSNEHTESVTTLQDENRKHSEAIADLSQQEKSRRDKEDNSVKEPQQSPVTNINIYGGNVLIGEGGEIREKGAPGTWLQSMQNSKGLTIGVFLAVVVVAVGIYFGTGKSRDNVAKMSDGLKRQYTAALENWTMPILRLSKHKGTFGNTKKRRKTAMIEPLLREIIEKNDEKPHSTLHETHQRNLNMFGLQNISLIEIRDVMQKDSKITIVQGTGGTGKTSLVDYITYQWAQNEMFKREEEMQFSFVFRFQCRSLNRYKGRKLTANDLFMENFNVNISDIGDKAEKILIILDGFDEYFAYSDIFKFSSKEDSITRIVRNLVTQGTVLFPGHYTLVTGRQHAVDLLQTREKDTGKARWVEVLGFSEHAMKKYVDQISEGNLSLAAYINGRIASSVTLQSLATTPVFLRTLCSVLYREGDEFIDASLVKMTDIYSWIVGSFLKFHFASKDQEFSEIRLNELFSRGDVRKFLRDISEDAYKLLVANELQFDCKKLSSLDMSDPVIRNLVNGFVIRSEDEIESKCEFWHVTMQEYFAAYHCVTQMECPTLILQENNWDKTVQFMAGFISTRRRKANSINHLLVGKFLRMEDDRINNFLYNEPFLEASCNRACKRRFLEIFFESFAIDDIFSAHLGPRHWGLKSVLDTGMLLRWNILSLSDAVLFSHFGKIMIANGVGSKLGDFWLWLINIRLKKNVLIELFEVLPVCHFASMVSIRLVDTLDSDTSKRLLVPFKNGIHSLSFLDLKGCYLSNDTGNLVLDVIPYMEKVNIHFQNFTVSNAKRLARASRRSLAKKSSASAFRLKEIEFGFCSFENGTDAHLAKFLPYVNTLRIFSSESLYGLQRVAEGITNVLTNTSIGFERKLNNLDLCNFDHVPSDSISGLAAGIPYLETISLDCVMLTKRFVTELVKSFLDILKKNGEIKLRKFQICCSLLKQDSSCYKSHEAWIAQILPSVDKSTISFATANSYKHFELGGYEDFIADGIAKIIPFIPYVDVETIGLSLNDLKALSTSVLRCATSNKKKKYFKLQHFRFTLMYRYSLATKYIYLSKHMVKLESLTVHSKKELVNVIAKPLSELKTNFVSLLEKFSYCLLISKESEAVLPVIKSHLRGIAKIVNVNMHLAQKLKINWRKSNEAASFVILFMNQRVVNTLRKGKLKRDLEIVEEIAVDIKSGIEKAKNYIFKESNNSVWCLKELERIERKVANCSNLNMQYNETTKAIEKVQEEKVKLSSEIEELRASSRAIKHPALDMLIRSQRLKEDKMIKLHSEAIELLVQQNQSVSRKDKVLEINSKFLSINRHFKMVIGIFPNQSLTQQSFKYWPVKSLQHAARLIPFVKTVDMGVGVSSSLVDWCEVLLENVRKIAMVKKFKDKFALRSFNLFILGKGIMQDCSKLILKELGEV